MIKYLLVFLGLTIFSLNSNAACDAVSCIGVKSEVVKSLYPTQGGKVYLEAPSDKSNLNCALAEGHYMVLEPTHPLFSETYSMILTAMASGMRFQVRIAEGSSNCRVAYVRMWY